MTATDDHLDRMLQERGDRWRAAQPAPAPIDVGLFAPDRRRWRGVAAVTCAVAASVATVAVVRVAADDRRSGADDIAAPTGTISATTPAGETFTAGTGTAAVTVTRRIVQPKRLAETRLDELATYWGAATLAVIGDRVYVDGAELELPADGRLHELPRPADASGQLRDALASPTSGRLHLLYQDPEELDRAYVWTAADTVTESSDFTLSTVELGESRRRALQLAANDDGLWVVAGDGRELWAVDHDANAPIGIPLPGGLSVLTGYADSPYLQVLDPPRNVVADLTGTYRLVDVLSARGQVVWLAVAPESALGSVELLRLDLTNRTGVAVPLDTGISAPAIAVDPAGTVTVVGYRNDTVFADAYAWPLD